MVDTTEREKRINLLKSSPEIPSDLKEYLHTSPLKNLALVERYINEIEQKKIKITPSEEINEEVVASFAQIYRYPVVLTSEVVNLIEQAILSRSDFGDFGASWGRYAWDLAWMATRTGVEMPLGTVVFPCQIGGEVRSIASTVIYSMECIVFGTFSEILGTQKPLASSQH